MPSFCASSRLHLDPSHPLLGAGEGEDLLTHLGKSLQGPPCRLGKPETLPCLPTPFLVPICLLREQSWSRQGRTRGVLGPGWAAPARGVLWVEAALPSPTPPSPACLCSSTPRRAQSEGQPALGRGKKPPGPALSAAFAFLGSDPGQALGGPKAPGQMVPTAAPGPGLSGVTAPHPEASVPSRAQSSLSLSRPH